MMRDTPATTVASSHDIFAAFAAHGALLAEISATLVPGDDELCDPPSTTEFLKALFANTTGPAYVCSFTNERGAGPERRLIGRSSANTLAFMKKWDKLGRGLFVCVSVLKEGAQKRNKENIEQIVTLHCDIDYKNIDALGGDVEHEVLKQLARLRLLPSTTVLSGGGVHAYWFLREPLDAQENMESVETALRQLCDVVGGDPAVCEISRVMRLPGTHNTKTGEMRPVEIASFDPDRRYELDDIEEWLSEQSVVLLRKSRERGATIAQTDLDFFERYAREHGIKPPIDVEARLKNMMYMGPKESSIHWTQIQCASSMLASGTPVDEVVSILLAATRVAAGDYGARWNWRMEERAIRRDCEKFVNDHPDVAEKIKRKQKAELQTIEGGKSKDAVASVGSAETVEQQTVAAAGNVIKMPVITPAAEEPPKAGEMHIALGKSVLAYMRAHDEQLINTKEGCWFYSNGIWELRTDTKWLDVRIEGNCIGFSLKSGTKLINETRNWILRQPELWRDGELPWDQHGKIPTRSGLVNPRTGELEPSRPDHFCTWRIECDFDPQAKCPWWQVMIADMFGDKPEAEQIGLVCVVQELMGAALIDKKPRALSKACVFWGIQNRAKSGVLDVVAGMFGGRPISAPIGSVDSPHGLMPFQRRAPWILHEAFGPQWHPSATVKSIVTADPVMINIKNGPMLTQIVRAPIFWATNFQPQLKEATRAVVDRMVIIEVTRAFDEAKPIGAAAEAIKQGYSKPGEFIVATELPGVLNWAIAGLKRALERGSIEVTSGIKATADTIHQDSNLVAGFIEDCIEFDPNARVRMPDFCLAHSAWWLELKGEDRKLPTNEAINKAVKAIDDGRIGMDRKEMRDNTSRYYCGIALNKAGLRYHRVAFESKVFEGKIATATNPGDPKREVNSLIPPGWSERESVIKMRAQHDNRS